MRFRASSISSVSLRAKALEKLARLSYQNADAEDDTLSVVARSLPVFYSSTPSKLYTIPLNMNEWEILTSLANSVPHTQQQAKKLLTTIIAPYFVQLPRQRFTEGLMSQFKLQSLKHPTEVLTYVLTNALLCICSRFPELQVYCFDLVGKYLGLVSELFLTRISSVFSLLGFMGAFIGNGTATKLSEYAWVKLASMFNKSEFLEQFEKTLACSQNYIVDWVVTYAEAGCEISTVLFLNLLANMQTSYAKTALSLNMGENTLSEILLLAQSQQSDFEQSGQELKQTTYKLDAIKKMVKQNKMVIKQMCQFALAYCQNIDNMDLLTENRAQLSLDARANFIDYMCLIPYIETEDDYLYTQFVTNITESLEKYMCSERTTTKLLISLVTAASLQNYFTEENSLLLLRLFPMVIASDHITTDIVVKICKLFTHGLKPLNEDSIVNTIYSINNIIAVSENGDPAPGIRERQLTMSSTLNHFQIRGQNLTSDTLEAVKNTNIHFSSRSASNVNMNSANSTKQPTEFHELLFRNCVTATGTIASHYHDKSITALAISILTQKVNVMSKNLDDIILNTLADLALFTSPTEFSSMLKFFRLTMSNAKKAENHALLEAIHSCRTKISKQLRATSYGSELYQLQLYDILDIIISCGEVEKLEHHRSHTEISVVAEMIASHLEPLASLLPKVGEIPLDYKADEQATNMLRNVWFNMVIHGFHYRSELVKKHYSSLGIIAYNSPPLTSEFPANNKEMSLEMNTILRRGTSNSNVKEQKQVVAEYSKGNAMQSRTMSTMNTMFLAATVLLETIRCEFGVCSQVLLYMSDPSTKSNSIEKSIAQINYAIVKKFSTIAQSGVSTRFSSGIIATQLNSMLLNLCHRDSALQNAAFNSCDLLIKSIPSSLCHHRSLYTLLDIMTVLFDGILDSEMNKFEPHYEFMLKHSSIKVLLPGSGSWRKGTLSRLQKSATEWVKIAMTKSNSDTKILLQSYISDLGEFNRPTTVEYGVSFAINIASSIMSADKELSRMTFIGSEKPNTIAEFISQHSWRSRYLINKAITSSPQDIVKEVGALSRQIKELLEANLDIPLDVITEFLDLSATMIILGADESSSLVHDVVRIPFEVFTKEAIKASVNVWLTIIKERTDLAHVLLGDIGYYWMDTIDKGLGLYCRAYDLIREEYQVMEYTPYNKKLIDSDAHKALESLEPHSYVIRFFVSHFEGTLLQSDHLLKLFTVWCLYGVESLSKASLHPFAASIRNELLNFALTVLNVNYKQGTKYVGKLSRSIVRGALSWFKTPFSWPFGSNELMIKADLSTLSDLSSQISRIAKITTQYAKEETKILQMCVKSEIQGIKTWLSPLNKANDSGSNVELTSQMVDFLFEYDPQLALSLSLRFPGKDAKQRIGAKMQQAPLSLVGSPEALDIFLETSRNLPKPDMHYITYWCPCPPLSSVNLFLPQWKHNRFILQYAVFSLEYHDVNVTFFYVPQIVQCLRYDQSGYVERLILDTAKTSTLFSHQIIWNMLANCYKGDEGLEEDDIKPILDRVRTRMVSEFSGMHKEFYEREFGFFNEVTAISGKLKPYIKKSKAEKKHKIDEEMAKIVVKPDVYLPSNPDGIIIDIDRKSGKPLQSHAKAPFMATFKIKKQVRDPDSGKKVTLEKWQAAIFKVGDDCRQDVLALQLISMFRTIWSNIGLDVFVFPYRVTATAPGCGVIDVLPNSISRDMLGREAVNGLYEYFISKFGDENTIAFQNARNNFVKSLAGYSVISYLLQFKDRHNGNIMYDDQGHCLHIDFGFIFDIVPGGVKFEAVPFKLTKEMVKVMGGSPESPAYHAFEELCIKAYLAARPHMTAIIQCVKPMLDSGLPCFKGMKTLKNLEARFQPQKSNHEAGMFMKSLIKKSYESLFTKGYDEFQRLTNGIPY